MHITIRLPKVADRPASEPRLCPYVGCGGTRFSLYQRCSKYISDFKGSRVSADRYMCLRCRRTFRNYPEGVGRAHQSRWLSNLTVLLYAIGLSYDGVAHFLNFIECDVSKTTVYRDVQRASAVIETLRQERRQRALRSQLRVVASDTVLFQCQGEDNIFGSLMRGERDDRLILRTVNGNGSHLALQNWIEEIAHALGLETWVGEPGVYSTRYLSPNLERANVPPPLDTRAVVM